MALAMFGCKAKDSSSSPAPSASASGQAAVASGPCGEYSQRLCAEAGEQSQTCQSLTQNMELLPPKACEAALKEIDYSLKKLAEKKKACDELTKKLCAGLGEKTQTCEMVRKETKAFPPERCDMMLEHFDEVLADLKKQEEANKPLSDDMQKTIAKEGPAFGPENAKVTLVEFSDFECPFCSRAASVVEKIREKYGDRVRFVFRQFPLPMHKNAHEAAEAALAAHAQGKFWKFHDTLFENQRSLDAESLTEHAKKAGLDVASFKQALESNKYAAAVDADMKLGSQVDVQGTPTMFINGKRIQDPTNFDSISRLIDEALES